MASSWATASPAFAELRGAGDLEPSLLQVEQSNTSVRFGDRLILKLFRRLEPGINPDLEIGRFLTGETDFALGAAAEALALARRCRYASLVPVCGLRQALRRGVGRCSLA